MLRKIFFFIFIGLFHNASLWSQEKPFFHNSITTSFMNSGGDGVPMWLHGRQQGRWDQIEKTQWVNMLQSSFGYKPASDWNLHASLELDYQPFNSKAYFHTAQISAQYKFLSLRLGRHLFDPLHEETNLGSGSYLFGDNYRPLFRVTAGIPNYTPLPFFLKRIEVKGEISHGRLDDHWHEWSHKNELLHEKYAYLRVNLGRVKPYVGISHSAIMGGYYNDGSQIPIDFWNTFMAKGSEKIGGGDATNAAGAHMGLYDVGAYLTTPNHGDFHFYYQAPFSDSSGMWFLIRNIDQIFGFNWTLPQSSFLNTITLEWISTSHQSGNGMPDARFSIDGDKQEFVISFMLDDPDYRKDLMTRLGADNPSSYSKDEVSDYLKDRFNNGNRFGGRDGYMSNGTYPSGWSYYGDVMGSPLNLNQYQLQHNNPELGSYTRNLIVNDRYKAIHFGASGHVTSSLGWVFKATFTKNYGSYFQEYPGRYTWDRTENYFFEEGLQQTYLMMGGKWNPEKISSLTISTEFGLDRGAIFNSYGAKIGVNYAF